jgi:hypothetical protein
MQSFNTGTIGTSRDICPECPDQRDIERDILAGQGLGLLNSPVCPASCPVSRSKKPGCHVRMAIGAGNVG